jgi:hypothetical protein
VSITMYGIDRDKGELVSRDISSLIVTDMIDPSGNIMPRDYRFNQCFASKWEATQWLYKTTMDRIQANAKETTECMELLEKFRQLKD